MTLSETPLSQPARKVPSWIPIAMLVLAGIGFFDASYLTLKHYQGGSVGCFLTTGCDAVTTSQYSEILGIPVAALGAAYYAAILFGLGFYFAHRQSQILPWLCLFTIAGLLASGWFVYVQAILLKQFCFYCMISAGTSTGLFILGMALLARRLTFGRR